MRLFLNVFLRKGLQIIKFILYYTYNDLIKCKTMNLIMLKSITIEVKKKAMS
jgi:hypothetical protein